MGHGWLRQVEQWDQLAHAQLAGVLTQHVDELHPHRIAERLGDGGHPLGPLATHVRIHERLAARQSRRALLFRDDLQFDGDPLTYIDLSDRRQPRSPTA